MPSSLRDEKSMTVYGRVMLFILYSVGDEEEEEEFV